MKLPVQAPRCIGLVATFHLKYHGCTVTVQAGWFAAAPSCGVVIVAADGSQTLLYVQTLTYDATCTYRGCFLSVHAAGTGS
jgi:hypothetical protein